MRYALLIVVVAMSAAAQPNVLFIISDDLQACMSSYGNKQCKTPNIDRLAREGVSFDRAYCQYPLCGPSRASLMSGLYPKTSGITGNNDKFGSYRVVNPKLANHPSMSGFLRENGYFTARTSKIYHMGVPGGIEQGAPGGDDPDSWDYAYNVMANETLSPGERLLLSPKKSHYGSSFAATIVPDHLAETQADHMSVTQTIAILEARVRKVIPGATNKKKLKPDSPFFIGAGLVRPHVPLVAPKRFWDMYPKVVLPEVPEDDHLDVPKPAMAKHNDKAFMMTPEQQERALAGYFASVSYMDEQVGRLLDALDRLDLRKNTIVIFCSDHGWNLGEHGCWQKSNFWDETTRVPLIISAPGFEASAGKRTRAVVELIDLYPTLADLCGKQDKAPSILQGKTLRPYLEKPAHTDDNTAYVMLGRGADTVITNRWRYSTWGKAGEELYDLDKDPREFTNLAKNPEFAATLEQMRTKLKAKP
jgi:arylsulfatase A-like enzyme